MNWLWRRNQTEPKTTEVVNIEHNKSLRQNNIDHFINHDKYSGWYEQSQTKIGAFLVGHISSSEMLLNFRLYFGPSIR